jgi:hypothetical protein
VKIDFDKGQKQKNGGGCPPATSFSLSRQRKRKQKKTTRSLALLCRVHCAEKMKDGRTKTRYAQTVRPAGRL